MRILLAIASNRTRDELTQALGAQGHEVIGSSSRGEELLLAIERAEPVHVALLTQAGLGGHWLRLLRQLRRRMPGVRALVLLRPGAEQHWRRAMMAGAFDVLPGSAQPEALLEATRRALRSAASHLPAQPDARREKFPGAGRSKVAMARPDSFNHRRAP